MARNPMFARIAAVILGVMTAARLSAFPEMSRQTQSACVACHSVAAGGADLTDAGKLFQTKKKAPAATTAKAAQFVGNEKCRSCHYAEHKAWSQTTHAMALSRLQAAEPAKVTAMATKLKVTLKAAPASTDACVTCHVTGFKLPTGYPAADSAKTAALAGVTCESCHGPGSIHVFATVADKKKTIHGAVSAATCKQCHTATISPAFDFDTAVKTVHAVPKDE